MNYVISVDSTTDLLEEDYERFGFIKMKLLVNIDNHTLYDGQMPSKEFYEKMRKGSAPTTSQVNVNDYINAFTPYLEDGKDILAIGFSSALSGTFNALRLATDMLKETYPNRRIEIVDSLSASMGEGLIAYYAGLMYENNATLDEVYNFIEENKLKMHHLFTVSNLEYLKRGGRVSATSAFIANALKIKPVLYVDNQGRLIPIKKVIGRKQSLSTIFDMFEKYYSKNNNIVFISHGDCEDEAIMLGEKIKEKYDVTIKYNNIGAVIGSHSGPGTIALFFLSDVERKDR